MALSQAELRQASYRSYSPLAKSLNEARTRGLRTVFLSHSHADRLEAEGLTALLVATGWEVYIDWKDGTLPDSPNEETARGIRAAISRSAFLLFLATADSIRSRWCPWEIGLADGLLGHDCVLIAPTVDDRSITYGQEYLGIYRHLDVSDDGRIGVWAPGQSRGVLAESL